MRVHPITAFQYIRKLGEKKKKKKKRFNTNKASTDDPEFFRNGHCNNGNFKQISLLGKFFKTNFSLLIQLNQILR